MHAFRHSVQDRQRHPVKWDRIDKSEDRIRQQVCLKIIEENLTTKKNICHSTSHRIMVLKLKNPQKKHSTIKLISILIASFYEIILPVYSIECVY